MANPKEVAARIEAAIEQVNDQSLSGYMAAGAMRELAAAWRTYDASVSPETVVSDTEDACAMLRKMAQVAIRAV